MQTSAREAMVRVQEGAVMDEAAGAAISSGTVIRSMDGIVTFWSHGMAQRYGFTRQAALGRPLPRLLRTMLPATRSRIEADFLEHGVWTGGAVNFHSDGSKIATATRWAIIPGVDGEAGSVVETHSDIRPRGVGGCRQLKDLMEIVAQELREALSALNAYNVGTHLALNQSLLDREILRGAAAESDRQISRSADALHSLCSIINTIAENE